MSPFLDFKFLRKTLSLRFVDPLTTPPALPERPNSKKSSTSNDIGRREIKKSSGTKDVEASNRRRTKLAALAPPHEAASSSAGQPSTPSSLSLSDLGSKRSSSSSTVASTTDDSSYRSQFSETPCSVEHRSSKSAASGQERASHQKTKFVASSQDHIESPRLNKAKSKRSEEARSGKAKELSDSCNERTTQNKAIKRTSSKGSAKKSSSRAPVTRKNFETIKSFKRSESFTDKESLPHLDKANARFTRTYPEYLGTAVADKIREEEYPHLEERGHVCLDYSGYGLFSESQQRWHQSSSSFEVAYISANLPTHALYGYADQGTVEFDIGHQVCQSLNVKESEYCVIFTESRASAFKVLAESYPFCLNTNLLTVYDYESDGVNWMEETARKKGANVMSACFRWPSQHLCASDLQKKIIDNKTKKKKKKKKDESGKGLFVFPMQSGVTGAKYSYQWMAQAHENEWDVLLDASALGPKIMGSLGLSVFRPDFIVSSFYKVYGSDPTGFGCLLIKRSAIQRLHSSSTTGSVGIVKLVAPSDTVGEGVMYEDKEKTGYDTEEEEEEKQEERILAHSLSFLDRIGEDDECGTFDTFSFHEGDMSDSEFILFEHPTVDDSMQAEIRDKLNATEDGRFSMGSQSWEENEAGSYSFSETSSQPEKLYGQQNFSASTYNIEKLFKQQNLYSSSRYTDSPADHSFLYSQDESYENDESFLSGTDDDDEPIEIPRKEPEIVCRGLDHVDMLGLSKSNTRLRCLINWLVGSMLKLQHPGCHPLVQIYGPKISYDRGASVAFNLSDQRGNILQPLLVQRLAERSNISLRTSTLRQIQQLEEGRKLASMEVISASLGFITNFADVYRFWAFLAKFLDADFVSKEVCNASSPMY